MRLQGCGNEDMPSGGENKRRASFFGRPPAIRWGAMDARRGPDAGVTLASSKALKRPAGSNGISSAYLRPARRWSENRAQVVQAVCYNPTEAAEKVREKTELALNLLQEARRA